MVSGAEFADALERHGFDFFAGVPCSLIEDLIAMLESHPRLPYVATPREDVAVGLAAGTGGSGIAAASVIPLGPVPAAFAGIAIGVNGLLTALLAPLLARMFSHW